MRIDDPVSVLPLLVGIALAILCARVLRPWFAMDDEVNDFESIDGLRGYLALFVVFNHASIWYFYVRSMRWEAPPSALYNLLGQVGVALFFMITAFLFVGKLLKASGANEFDWQRFLVSRVLRILPMYVVAVAALFVIVAIVSGGVQRVPTGQLMREMGQWLLFTFSGVPHINGVSNTVAILGSAWTLPYEWFFYVSLPIIGLALLQKRSYGYALFGGLCALVMLSSWRPANAQLLSFAIGAGVAWLRRLPAFCRFSEGVPASIFIIGTSISLPIFFFDAWRGVPLSLIGLSFAFIAGGNSLFGVLKRPTSRFLGRITYSVYLLHLIFLFIVFRFIIGYERGAQLSPLQHWSAVLLALPVMLFVCSLTFHAIEAPAMAKVQDANDWLKRRRMRARP